MAVAFIQEFKIQGDDRSTTNYDTINERLNTRNDPPEGGIVHTAGFVSQPFMVVPSKIDVHPA